MRARVFPLLAGLSVVSWVGGARADVTTAECVAAAEQGQKLQSDGQLLQAKEKFLICGRDACPKIIRQDCTKWEGEVVAALPTVVLGAKDPKGNDVSNVAVTIDVEPVTDELSGTPTPLNPGTHRFVFKREGLPPVILTILIREGEKNRLVTAHLGADGGGAGGDTSSGDGSSPKDHKPSAPPPTAAYVLLGVGAVTAGVALYGLIAGEASTSALKSGCGASLDGCSASQINHAQTQLWLGDIAAPVSVVAFAVATYLFVRPPDASPPPSASATPNVSFAPLPGGGFVSWGRAF